MSVRDSFFEELERYGIHRSEVEEVKIVKGKLVIVRTNTNRTIKISEPYLLEKAKIIASNQPPYSLTLHNREYWLKRLFGLLFFEGRETRFSDILREYRNTPTNKIVEIVLEKERKHSLDDQQQAKFYREALLTRICKELTLLHGIPYKDFEDDNKIYPPTTDNMLEALVRLYS